MDKLRALLAFDDEVVSTKKFLLLLGVAYLFSVVIRLFWVYAMGDDASMQWNGQLMINTNDGYYWAEGARDILRGEKHYVTSPVTNPTSLLTAYITMVLPISIETVILFLPAVIGSLLVIPIMLIGRVLKQDILGFFAAMLGAITWSYYNRTMVGYYDTDMFVVVLPTMIVFGLIAALTAKDTRLLSIAPLFVILSIYWHPSGYQIANALLMMLILYTVIFARKEIYNYKLLSVYMLALISAPVLIKIGLVLLLASVFHFLRARLITRYVILLGIVAVILYFVFGGSNWLLGLVKNAYIVRVLFAADEAPALKFFSVVQTVREAGDIPFDLFANRISGHTVTFMLSVVGYIMMGIRYPLFFLSLPMVVLGFFAFKGGLRFTVFAVPFMSLGFFFLAFFVLSKLVQNKSAKYAAASLIAIAALYPNVTHILEYKVPTVFNSSEVRVLDQLRQKAAREDYVVSWWDYGYPIRYYSDINTLVDGGKHSGNVNFPVSYALTYSQAESANMARLDVEYTEQGYQTGKKGSNIRHMLEDYGYRDTNTFLTQLNSKEFPLPEKTRDVYYYLPMRMMNIYQTVRLFSNLDLMTGNRYAQPFLYMSAGYQEMGEKIQLGNGIEIDKRSNTIRLGKQEIAINSLYVTMYDNQGKLHVQQQNFNLMAPLSLVYMKSYNKFLVMDQQTLNSTYMQLFVLENYDPELFEPVILTPLAKVYRLKK